MQCIVKMTNLRRRTQNCYNDAKQCKNTNLSQEYARWNKNVFKRVPGAQPATEKALLPNDSQVLGTSRVRMSADRKPLLRPTQDVSVT